MGSGLRWSRVKRAVRYLGGAPPWPYWPAGREYSLIELVMRHILAETTNILWIIRRGHRIRLKVPDLGNMMTEEKCELLYNLVLRHRRPGIIVEVGCYRGCSTAYLAKAGMEAGMIALYAIDTFTGTGGQKQTYSDFMTTMRINGLDHFVVPVRGKSTDVAATWTRPIEILHIDADHRYEAVKSDIESWTPFLTVGGIVIFDDYDACHEGVVRAIHELLTTQRYQVIELVPEDDSGAWGSVACRKMK